MSAKPLALNDDAYSALMVLGQNLGILGEMFTGGEESPEALRMVVATIREAATLLEGVCDEWEAP